MNAYSELLTIRIEHPYFGGPIPAHEMEIAIADESRKLFESAGLRMRVGDGRISGLYSNEERDFAALKSWYAYGSAQAECSMKLEFEIKIKNAAFFQGSAQGLIDGKNPLVFSNFEQPSSAETETTKAQPRGETTKGQPNGETTKGQPHGETTKGQPNGETTKGQPNGETSKAQPNGETTKGQPHGETSTARPGVQLTNLERETTNLERETTNLERETGDARRKSFAPRPTLSIRVGLDKHGQDIFGGEDPDKQPRKEEYAVRFEPLRLPRLYWIWMREKAAEKITEGLKIDDELIIERNRNQAAENPDAPENPEIDFEFISLEDTRRGRRAFKFLSSSPLVVTAVDEESFCLNHVSKTKKRTLVERLPGPGSGTLDKMEERGLQVTSIHVNV